MATIARRGFLVSAMGAMVALAAITVGCGGSGGGSKTVGRAPSETTRARVQTLHDLTVRGISQSGYQTSSLAFARNGFLAMDAVGGAGTATGSAGNAAPPSSAAGTTMPMIGAFLRNVASVPTATRAARITVHKGRAEDIAIGEPAPSPPMPPDDSQPFEPAPTFYYDYYLGLWVQIDETPGKVTYALFEDEQKATAAGSIETIQPTDYETYPQLYKSTYQFKAGFLAGSHGDSENVTMADGSGSSTYENVYSDGWKDSGKSSWSGRGDYTWSSRTETGTSEWTESAGSFRADGGGGTRITTSDGYSANYTFNANGSGHGRIEGNDPGLPVDISWDSYGNTTIRYADGTIERIPGWGGSYGGGNGGGVVGMPVPVDDTVSDSNGKSGI